MSKTSTLRIISIFVLALVLLPSMYSAWWDENWPLKQELNISVSSGTTPANYSVELILNSSNVGTGFDWNNECSNNASRLRITNANETVSLPYWVEECSALAENMTLWIKYDDNITTSGVSAFMYYGNVFASLYSDAENTFEFFMNLTGLTEQSEGSGSSQDISGGVSISGSGTQINFYGNPWKVYSGFSFPISISNTGNQILELDMYSEDCGEISAIKFDTNTVQEDSNNPRWCGTQVSWGIVPDQGYTGTGSWQEVFHVLDSFTVSATHLHIVGDDDIDASTNSSFKNVRIRKYVSSEPITSIGEEQAINLSVTSLLPLNGTTLGNLTWTFTCNVVADNTSTLSNVSLYGNWTGSWQLNETISVSGNVNRSQFTKTFLDSSASYLWNCEARDNSGASAFFDTNYTFNVDRTPPLISLNNPVGTLSDVTPIIDVNISEIGSIWYSLNSSANVTLCTNCNSTSSRFAYVEEGDYEISIYVNDTYGNENALLNQPFTVDMQNSYNDTFLDNSSVRIYNDSVYNSGGIEYSGGGIDFFQGIQIGYDTGNLTFIANQWGGSGNAGEVDITCPGGDSNCQFTTLNGSVITGIDIGNGVVTEDSDSTTVGFIMYTQENINTRFGPQPIPQASDNLAAVCYVAGQWFYDDNNGCDEAFTPVASDVLIANVTWGINSVTDLVGAITSGNTTIYSYPINTTLNITEINIVDWSASGISGSNNISIDISVDGGSTWYNATNGAAISNITQGYSLVYRVNMASDGITTVSLDSLNITWSTNQNSVPQLTLFNPGNNTKVFGNGSVEFLWNVFDNSPSLNCTLFINGVEKQTSTCLSGTNTSINLSLEPGFYNWSVNVSDSDNNSIIRTFYFHNILNISQRFTKSIISENIDQYLVRLIVENLANFVYSFTALDFVHNTFTAGSFTPNFNFSNVTSTLPINGTIYGWEFNSTQEINYSISGIGDYNLDENYVIVG